MNKPNSFTPNTIHFSDNIQYLKTLPSNSIDAVITDSPYGLGKEPPTLELLNAWLAKGYYEVKGKGFMGMAWDAFVPQPVLWKECFRVLKPGGYVLSFFGTRTYHWGTLAIQLAGFEIRDCIQWIYASGLPKSRSHLKPAYEPICVARKPGLLFRIGIDEARIPFHSEQDRIKANSVFIKQPASRKIYRKYKNRVGPFKSNDNGRWPSNVILDEESADLLDKQSSTVYTHKKRQGKTDRGAIGGPSRFFYIAKASQFERKENLHPTVKPIKLMEQLVKLYCPAGGILLDPHMGSGTTCMAAIATGRNYIGVDNDKFSYDIAKRRLQNI